MLILTFSIFYIYSLYSKDQDFKSAQIHFKDVKKKKNYKSDLDAARDLYSH